MHHASATLVDIEIDGVRRRIEVHQCGDTCYLDSPLGATTLVELPRFPEPDLLAAHGSLIAPMPGTIVRVLVSPGDVIGSGDAVLVLEAMKMEHTVRAPHPGVVKEIRVTLGQAVDVGVTLAVVEEAE